MAQLLSQLIGHQDIVQHLWQAQNHGRLASTFLFVGPDGVGRKKLAMALSQNLVCERWAPSRGKSENASDSLSMACGECGPCLRLAKQQSESLLVLTPEKNLIKMEQAHKILDFLRLQAISRARITIIDSAHQMNAAAANTLLKILEEPPASCYFFLIAPSPQHVLPTLRSRAQIVRFSPLSLAQMKTRVQAEDWILRASQGSFARLSNFQDSEESEIRQSAARLLELWLKDKQAFLQPEVRSLVKDREVAVKLSGYMQLILKDASVIQLNKASDANSAVKNSRIIPVDQVPLLMQLQNLSIQEIQELYQKALRLEFAFHTQRDPQLSLEEFWLA